MYNNISHYKRTYMFIFGDWRAIIYSHTATPEFMTKTDLLWNA
jgi:hypothetical protein